MVKSLLLFSERYGLCPWIIEDYLSPWDILSDKDIFIYQGILSHAKDYKMWYVVGTLGLLWSAQSPELPKKYGQLCEPLTSLYDQTPVKTLNIKAWVNFPGWQCVSSHIIAGKISTVCDSSGRGQLETSCLELSWTLFHMFLLWVDFNLYPFTIMNCNCEYTYNSF